MTSEIIVELHGARLMAGDRQLPPYNCLPGDRVDADLHFVARDRGTTLGLVTSVTESPRTVTVSFPLYGSACPSYATLKEIFAEVGDRLILELTAYGSIVYRGVETKAARYDARLFARLYQHQMEMRPEQLPPLPGFGTHHYTREGVMDHTDLDTFTIDPASTEDFDDALSVDATGLIYIHIVDIMAAMHRIDLPRVRTLGSSLYLANEKTEHLLSEEAMAATSLVEGRIRPVITVAVRLDSEGSVISYDIYRSWIQVKHRYTYEQVASLLSVREGPSGLSVLHDLAIRRSSAISYKIEMPSVRLTMNGIGEPIAVELESTTDAAHSLVSTAMILCNIVVSHHLKRRGLDLPNRFHSSLRGIPVTAVAADMSLVDTFCLLKKMARAEYSVDKRGHFGLGLTDYVHFTSPMRRYADIVTHMILAGAAFSRVSLEAEVALINRRATFVRSLQRFYQRIKVNRWLYSHPEEQRVIVTSVAAAGVQWFMPSILLNGFCHVSKLLPAQRWLMDLREGSSLVGASGKRVRVGDEVAVAVAGAPTDVQLQLSV
jgi:exoribonuclease R